MSKTRAIFATLASAALTAAGCTTVYTQADVERLEEKRDAEEAIASQEPPVTGPSLNRGGESPARNRTEAGSVCGDEIPMVAGEAGGGEASTVVDATSARVRVLRDGAIPRDALESR